jgi:hypothetical protein
MKIGSYFDLREFIPSSIWQKFGEKSIWFMDKRIFLLADFIRSRFGKPMKINDWLNGGALSLRGFRPPDTTIGGVLSQHKFGRAIDFNIEGSAPQEVYKDINDHFDMYSKAGLTTVEDIAFTKTWTHCDIRQTDSDKLLIVKP